MPRMRQMKMYLSIRYALHTIVRESINVVDKLRGLYHILTSFREKNKCCEDTICISTTFIIEPEFLHIEWTMCICSDLSARKDEESMLYECVA